VTENRDDLAATLATARAALELLAPYGIGETRGRGGSQHRCNPPGDSTAAEGTPMISSVEIYRGGPVRNAQSQQRIDEIVKPQIDQVFETTDISALVAWCDDVTKSPESRLVAPAVLEAMHELAVAERWGRPAIDLDYVRACVAGCDSVRWRSPYEYYSVVDTWGSGERGADMRPEEYRALVESDAAAAEYGT
jgi:hypothetical protein